MLDLWGYSTRHRQAATMVFAEHIAVRALAFVVVHEVVAVPWSASTFWAVFDVAAEPRGTEHEFLEAAVALAHEVVDVGTAWILLVHTDAMLHTSIRRRDAVVVVPAGSRGCQLSIRLTYHVVLHEFAVKQAILGEPSVAPELRRLSEN
jgi:hypothetical protein